MHEEAGLRVGFQGVVAGHPGISTENESGRIPERLIVFPLGELQLATGVHVQEEVRSVSRFKRNAGCICEGESRTCHFEEQQSREEESRWNHSL